MRGFGPIVVIDWNVTMLGYAMENFFMLSRIARSLRLDDVNLETFKGSE